MREVHQSVREAHEFCPLRCRKQRGAPDFSTMAYEQRYRPAPDRNVALREQIVKLAHRHRRQAQE
jgi:hypothetical protein